MKVLWSAAVFSIFLAGQPALAVDSDGHFVRARDAWESGDYELALSEYQAVINLTGDNAAVRHNRALIYLETDRAEEAKAEAARAVAMAPKEATYHITLAVAMMSLKTPDLAGARTQLLAAVKLLRGRGNSSDRCRAYYNLGVLYQRKMDFTEARRYYRLALEQDPNDQPTLDALDAMSSLEESQE